MHKKKGGAKGESSRSQEDTNQEMDIRKIMKDIEFLGSSHMTWKERKELENKKVVSLSGKPPKKQRLPLSVARVVMKKQKEREQKMLEESLILGRFGAKFSGGVKKLVVDKHKSRGMVLKSSEGYFRNGVLDLKHLLNPPPSRNNDVDTCALGKWKKKGSGKKKGKKKGGRGCH